MFATYAKKINDALVNPSAAFISRCIVALVAAGMADDFLKSLAAFMEKRPLTAPQNDAAVKVLRKKISPLAKLALAAAKKTETATAAPPQVAPPSVVAPPPAPAAPVKPSALPARGEKRVAKPRKPKQPKLPPLSKPERPEGGTTVGYTPTPDRDGLPPWEADDAALRGEMEVMAMV